MDIETQLGGKFSSKDMGLFDLKKRLQNAGVNVRYPEGDGIVAVRGGIELTFDPETEKRNFYEIELSYLECIKRNPIHIIHNKYEQRYGYIGESASIEALYAMVHSKPLLLLYPVALSNTVPLRAQEILIPRSQQFFITRIDNMKDDLKPYLAEIIETGSVDYNLSVSEELEIYNLMDGLLKKYAAI